MFGTSSVRTCDNYLYSLLKTIASRWSPNAKPSYYSIAWSPSMSSAASLFRFHLRSSRQGLMQRFPERDGTYFLPEQVVEYDRKRMQAREVVQLDLFVKDEESAIRWLRQQLNRRPRSFQDIHPDFIPELAGWQKHEHMLELSELLTQNFLRYDGTGPVPHPAPHLSLHQLQGTPQPPQGKTQPSKPKPKTAGMSPTQTRPPT